MVVVVVSVVVPMAWCHADGSVINMMVSLMVSLMVVVSEVVSLVESVVGGV